MNTDLVGPLQTLAARLVPGELTGLVLKAQRLALYEFRDRDEFPGVAARFKERALVQRERVQASPYYGFHLRSSAIIQRSLSSRSLRNGRVRSFTSKGGMLPAFTYSGAMRTELLKRPVRRVHGDGDSVGMRLSLHHRVLNFLGDKHGVQSVTMEKIPATYQMTVYKDSVAKAGAYKVSVTRQIRHRRIQRAAQTYAQEWAIRPAEAVWVQRRVDIEMNILLRAWRPKPGAQPMRVSA
jgi:hypothetical protein